LFFYSTAFAQIKFTDEGITMNLLNDKNDSLNSDFNNENNVSENRFGINFKIGRKFPETQKYGLKIDGGLWYGIGLNFKISKYFSMQPEINIWNSNESSKTFTYSLSVIELTDFICFDGFINDYYLKLYLGLGFATVRKELESENSFKENLLSINIGFSYILKIEKNIFVDFHFRRQYTGSTNLAGGSGYQSWLLGIITEIYL
jgi:hypothetical protein